MDLSTKLLKMQNAVVGKDIDRDTGFLLDLPKRPVGPSTTQVR